MKNGGHHIEYSKVARPWLEQLAAGQQFRDRFYPKYRPDRQCIPKQYQLFIQLDYPPYAWKEKAVTAFQNYITKGLGGWIGFHHGYFAW